MNLHYRLLPREWHLVLVVLSAMCLILMMMTNYMTLSRLRCWVCVRVSQSSRSSHSLHNQHRAELLHQNHHLMEWTTSLLTPGYKPALDLVYLVVLHPDSLRPVVVPLVGLQHQNVLCHYKKAM